MKRLFAILAVAVLVAACGNGDKKPQSIEEQLYEYVAQMENYVKADDYEKAESVYEAYEKWVESLSEAQMEELSIVLDKVDERLGILDEVGSSNYNGDAEENVVVPMVYSNSYDGYLNVRAQPTTKSQVLGTLRNGPEGAVLLGVEGKWSKVRVNGVEGYVSSAYVQSTPTQPVYINASAVVGHFGSIDSIIGYEWIYSIESNGKYTFGEYESGECDEESGKWYLSGTSIIFKSTTGSTRTFKVDAQGRRLIDGDAVYHRLN